jgi:predicted small lipoprotein YifL
MAMAVRFAALMAAVAVLAGCGQKGPLYLPDKGGQVVTRPGGQAQQQAPQSQSQPANADDDQKNNQQNQSPQNPPN